MRGVFWDSKAGCAKFADTDDALAQLGLRSAYHAKTGEALGAETHPTLRFMRDSGRGYHIDYVYASEGILASASNSLLPENDESAEFSDHSPLCLTLHVPS